MHQGRYYTEAVAWAKETGLVNGVTTERFCPNSPVTREQFAAILYRYAQLQGQDVSNQADLSAYLDAGKLSNYAQSPMAWAVAEGLIRGVSETTPLPQSLQHPGPGSRHPGALPHLGTRRLNSPQSHPNWGRTAPPMPSHGITTKCPQFLPILTPRRRGGSMCPLGRNIMRFSTTSGEFQMPTTGGHIGPPLRGYRNIVHK
ncbi:MAG: S-layer homology domain-containing protein [Oscillospiraceae bacterium]